MGDKYVSRERKNFLGEREVVTTREKSAAEDQAEVGKAIGTTIGVAGLLVGSAMRQRQSNKEAIFEQLVNSGFKAIESGDCDKAIEFGKRLIQRRDRDSTIMGQAIVGIALKGLEQHTEAVTYLTTSLNGIRAMGEEQGAANLYMHRGSAYLALDELSNAIQDFTTSIKLQPNEAAGYYYRALALQRIGDYEQALGNFNKAIALNPSDAANYRDRGLLHVAMGQSDKAGEDYTRALSLNPKSSYSYKLRGKLYVSVGNHEQAIRDLTQAIQLRQSDVESLQLRATSYNAIGATSKAEADQEQVKHLSSTLNRYGSYRQTADTLYQQGLNTWFTQADTVAKTRIGMVIGGVVLALLPFLCLGLTAEAYLFISSCYPLLMILISFTGAGFIIVQAYRGPRNRAKQATALLSALASQEQEKPAFTAFYEKYLLARKQGTLHDLSEQTLALFKL